MADSEADTRRPSTPAVDDGVGESDGVRGVVGVVEELAVMADDGVLDGVSPWPSEFDGVDDGVASPVTETVGAAVSEALAPTESDAVGVSDQDAGDDGLAVEAADVDGEA